MITKGWTLPNYALSTRDSDPGVSTSCHRSAVPVHQLFQQVVRRDSHSAAGIPLSAAYAAGLCFYGQRAPAARYGFSGGDVRGCDSGSWANWWRASASAKEFAAN